MTYNYKVGDFFKLYIEDEKTTKFGKLEEIFSEDGEKFIRYVVLYAPHELNLSEPYSSKNELIISDEIEKEFYSSITGKIEVMKMEVFLKRKLLNEKEKVLENNIFFSRQKYNSAKKSYSPDLEVLACCSKALNPDHEFLLCTSCKISLHKDCILGTISSGKCPKCNILLNKFNALGKKRLNEEKENEEKKDYYNLSANAQNYLFNFISKHKKVSSAIAQKSMTPDEKTRKIVKDELVYALVSFY